MLGYSLLKVPKALTIAGSDSGGGAGIEADLKTFSALGVYGLVAITSITAQNTREVKEVYDLPPEMVLKQIEAVVEDMGVDAAKTGMLSNRGIVEAVAHAVERYSFPLIVDTVMVSKTGASLLKLDAVELLVRKLVPRSALITSNLMEAETLTGMKVKSLEGAKKAAKHLVEELGAKAAVVKGGHIEGEEAVDILYYKGEFREYRAPKILEGCTHGVGCILSAAITAEVAKGSDLPDAVSVAKKFVTMAINYGARVGGGYCPANPMAWMEIPAEKFRVFEEVSRAVEIVEREGGLFANYVPEVQMNVVMALPKPYAKSIDDVAGVLGRIVRMKDTVKASGRVEFGASRHLARAVLKIMDFDPRVRAVLNLKYDEKLLEAAESLGFKVSFYDRREEPHEVRAVEGASTPWGVEVSVKKLGSIPDIIHHTGDWGKEPIISIFGHTATEVVEKALKLIHYAEVKP